MSDGVSATLPKIMYEFADGRGQKNAYIASLYKSQLCGAVNLAALLYLYLVISFALYVTKLNKCLILRTIQGLSVEQLVILEEVLIVQTQSQRISFVASLQQTSQECSLSGSSEIRDGFNQRRFIFSFLDYPQGELGKDQETKTSDDVATEMYK